MKKLILLLFISGLSLSVFAQTTSKNKKILKLLELTGSGKIGVQVARSMIEEFQKIYKDVDDKFWDSFAKEIDGDDLVNLIIPIYDKHYTEEDIDQLINFYNSPIGKKMIETLPAITEESMAAGQTWGRKIGEKVVQQLKDKGYLKD